MTTTSEIVISSRTKLGFGWSNTPCRDAFEVEPDTQPTTFGTIRQLESEIAQLAKIHSGGAWFVWSYYVRVDGGWVRIGACRSRDIRSDLMVHDGMGDRGQWTFPVEIA